MSDTGSKPKQGRWEKCFDAGVSWLTLALIAVVSYRSIPQIVYLDEAFTRAKVSDQPLLFSDYAHHSDIGPSVLRYRYLLASLSIAAPLGAVGAMFLRRWLRHAGLVVCLCVAIFVAIYTGIAIIFAT